mgnify:CR=1 FL=1
MINFDFKTCLPLFREWKSPVAVTGLLTLVYTHVGVIISQWFTTRLPHTCAAALGGTQVENVAFRLKKFAHPWHTL